MLLNFLAPSTNFLCLDQPIVIDTIANILMKGCSTANKRAAEVKPPMPNSCIALNPLGETKYNIRPTNN